MWCKTALCACLKVKSGALTKLACVIDQNALNLVIKEMVFTKSLAMVVLDSQQFPCGKVYFEDEKRMFLEDRGKKDVAYIVHNNFLHTKVPLNTKYSR